MTVDELAVAARDRVLDRAAASAPPDVSELRRRGEGRRRRRTVAGVACTVAVLAVAVTAIVSNRAQ